MRSNTFKLQTFGLAIMLSALLTFPLKAQDTLLHKTGNIENVGLVYQLQDYNWFQTYSGAVIDSGGIAVSGNTAFITSLPVKVPITNAEPFLSFTCALNMQNAAVNWGKLSFRSSIDGTHFTDWQPLTLELDDNSNYLGELVNIDKRTQYVQYQIDIKSTSDGFLLKNIRLTFINPGKTETEKLFQLKKKIASAKNKVGVSKPDVISRTDWGCTDGENAPLWNPKYSIVTHQVIHHTAMSNDTLQDYPATVRSIWSLHTYTNKWGDIGYNYLIDNYGNIYEGRAGGNNAIGAHCSKNSGTIGISVMGTYIDTVPSYAAILNLEELLAWKCIDSNIDPLDTVYHATSNLNLPTICGHRDVKTTECPGEAFYAELITIREKVKSLLENLTYNLSVTEKYKTITAAGGSINVDITTSLADFSVNKDVSWLTVTRNGNQVSIQVSPNKSTASRMAIVTLSGEGSYSTQIIVTQLGMSVGLQDNIKPSILVYPNPVNETLTISTSGINEKKITVTIKNITGQSVYQSVIENSLNGDIKLNLKHLAAGTYILYLSNNSQILNTQKFIKK